MLYSPVNVLYTCVLVYVGNALVHTFKRATDGPTAYGTITSLRMRAEVKCAFIISD